MNKCYTCRMYSLHTVYLQTCESTSTDPLVSAMHSKSSYPNGLDAPATLLDLPLSARSLVERALALVDPKYGFSTASVQIYDTAWVAMVRTP